MQSTGLNDDVNSKSGNLAIKNTNYSVSESGISTPSVQARVQLLKASAYKFDDSRDGISRRRKSFQSNFGIAHGIKKTPLKISNTFLLLVFTCFYGILQWIYKIFNRKKSEAICADDSARFQSSSDTIKKPNPEFESTILFLRKKFGTSLQSMWSEPDCSQVKVRGKTYLANKMKVIAGASTSRLIYIDVLRIPESGERLDHVAAIEMSRPVSIIKTIEENHPQIHLFVANFQLPGDPLLSIVGYWAVDISDQTSAFSTLYRRFAFSKDNDFRLSRLKLIPSIVSGPWIVTSTVPNRPAITGKKLTHRYYQGPNYIEVDLDLSSSVVASKVVQICRGFAAKLVVDLHFTLQGETEAELPEKVFASVRFDSLDLNISQDVEEYRCS